MDRDTRIDAVLAKNEIQEVLTIFCRGADRNDVEIMNFAFHPDAEADYGFFKGRAYDFSQWVAETHKENFTITSHELSNVLIVLDGDRATSEAYMDSRLRYKKDEGFGEVWTSVRYFGKWERRKSGWKMVHHMAVLDRYRTMDVQLDPMMHWLEQLPQVDRNKPDPSYNYIKLK